MPAVARASALCTALLTACDGDAPDGPARRPPPHPSEVARALEHVLDGQADPAEVEGYVANLRERAPNAGPWHEDLFVASTPDGFHIDLTAARRVATAAAVPQPVRDRDGRIRLLFVDGDLDRAERLARAGDPWMRDHGLLGYGAIDQLVSDDEGLTWTREPGFRVAGQVRGMVVDPEVHALPDGSWRLYEIGVPIPALVAPDAWADGSRHRVYSARSDDLVTWTLEGLAVEGPNADPAVWCDGDRCLMVSTGLDLSESQDGGRTFAFLDSFGVPGFAPAFLELPDGAVRLFYNSKDKGGPLRSMLSTDRGRTWQHEPGDRVPAFAIEAPSFLARPEGGWWVFYHYWHEGYSGDSWSQGYMARTDGEDREAPPPPTAPGEGGPGPTLCEDGPARPEDALLRLATGGARPCDREWAAHHLDERAGAPGPWASDVVLGLSGDGLEIDLGAVPAVARAGAPDLVQGPDGAVLLFTVGSGEAAARAALAAGGDWRGTPGMPGYGVLQLSVSRDGGASWEPDPGLALEGLDPGLVLDPDVVALAGGRWRLHVVHLTVPELTDRAAWEPGRAHRLVALESSDLRRWQAVGDVARVARAGPAVRCDGAACVLLSDGLELAASRDGGRSFGAPTRLSIAGAGPEIAALHDGRLRAYFAGQGAALLSALSADGGRTWAPEPGRRCPESAEAPSVLASPGGGWLVAVQRPRAGGGAGG